MKNLKVFFTIFFFTSVSIYGENENIISDDLGREFSSEETPQRLVSLAPSNTELLGALGLQSHLVGRTKYCNFPEEIKSVEVVAGFNTLDLEKIAALNPDVVFAIRGNDIESLKGLDRLGIPVFSLEIKDLDELLDAIQRLGIFLNVESRADSLISEFEDRIENVSQKVVDQIERPKVMWGLGDNTFYTAGNNTIIDDVIDLAGGTNVARDAVGSWPQVSIETVLMWSPEIIITTQVEGGQQGLSEEIERLSRTPVWERIPAIVDENVIYVEPDLLLRPGPRLLEALELIADFIIAYQTNR
ncbi:MAG: ABC transporter substrate-binding protein [Candidatus Latescibacterota bacterium]|nr:ABC transporter substrate-binding protein [Candidatus Latescibacterota bacterium]